MVLVARKTIRIKDLIIGLYIQRNSNLSKNRSKSMIAYNSLCIYFKQFKSINVNGRLQIILYMETIVIIFTYWKRLKLRTKTVSKNNKTRYIVFISMYFLIVLGKTFILYFTLKHCLFVTIKYSILEWKSYFWKQ